jgi:hypothetical protein
MPNQDDARKAARSAGKRGPLSRATLLILKFAVGFWIVLVNFDEAAKAAVIDSGKAGGSDHAIVVSVIHEAEQSPLRSAQFDRIDVGFGERPIATNKCNYVFMPGWEWRDIRVGPRPRVNDVTGKVDIYSHLENQRLSVADIYSLDSQLKSLVGYKCLRWSDAFDSYYWTVRGDEFFAGEINARSRQASLATRDKGENDCENRDKNGSSGSHSPVVSLQKINRFQNKIVSRSNIGAPGFRGSGF